MFNHEKHTTIWQIVDICEDTNCKDEKTINSRKHKVLATIKNHVNEINFRITDSRDGIDVEYNYLPLSLDVISSHFNKSISGFFEKEYKYAGYEDNQLRGLFNPMDDCIEKLKEYGYPSYATVLLLDIHFLKSSDEGVHLVNLLSRHAYFRMPSAQHYMEFVMEYEMDNLTALKRVKYYRYMCCYHSNIGGFLGNRLSRKTNECLSECLSDCTKQFPHGCNDCMGSEVIDCIHSCFNYLVAVVLGGYESPSHSKIPEGVIRQIRELLGNEGRPHIYRQSIQQTI